jgi:hypothetical protein
MQSARRAAETGTADQEIFIETEAFASAATRTGGLSGVLTQLWDVLVQIPESGGAVVVDWAGGTASHRLGLQRVIRERIRDRLKADPPTGFRALARIDGERIGTDPLDEAADILTAEGFDVTDGNVSRLVPPLAQAKVGAIADLKRAAAGDYSEDATLAKLPVLTRPALDLVKAFEEYATKGGLKGGALGPTAKRWRPKIKAFVKWLGPSRPFTDRDRRRLPLGGPPGRGRLRAKVCPRRLDRGAVGDGGLHGRAQEAGPEPVHPDQGPRRRRPEDRDGGAAEAEGFHPEGGDGHNRT